MLAYLPIPSRPGTDPTGAAVTTLQVGSSAFLDSSPPLPPPNGALGHRCQEEKEHSFIPCGKDCWGAAGTFSEGRLCLRPPLQGQGGGGGTAGPTGSTGPGRGYCLFLKSSPGRSQGQNHAARSVVPSTSRLPLPGRPPGYPPQRCSARRSSGQENENTSS